jgi:hypothetical protein
VDRDDLRAAWRRGQRGWPARYPLVQAPNAPLIVALVAWIVARVAADGTMHDAARAVFTAGLVVWAVLELAQGANVVRRVLGGVVLAALAARLVSGAG